MQIFEGQRLIALLFVEVVFVHNLRFPLALAAPLERVRFTRHSHQIYSPGRVRFVHVVAGHCLNVNDHAHPADLGDDVQRDQ